MEFRFSSIFLLTLEYSRTFIIHPWFPVREKGERTEILALKRESRIVRHCWDAQECIISCCSFSSQYLSTEQEEEALLKIQTERQWWRMIHPSNVWESYSRALEQAPLVKKWEKSGEKRENFSTLFSSLWRSSAESLPQSVMKKVIKLALSLLQGRATIAERGSPTILEHTWGGMIDHSRLLKGFSSFRWYFYLCFHTDHLNWALRLEVLATKRQIFEQL